MAVLWVVPVMAGGPQQPQDPQVRQVGNQVEILMGDPARQSFLGVNIWEVNAELAKKKQLPVSSGIYITSVLSGSAADKAGLGKGDVVVKFAGQDVIGEKQFVRLVRETPVGREVGVEVIREGDRTQMTVKMGSKKDLMALKTKQLETLRSKEPFSSPGLEGPKVFIPDVPHVYTTWRSPRLGIIGESLEAQLAEYFGVEEGVLVRSVGEDTPASRAGLRAGDVVVSVGSQPVATPREISHAILESQGTGITLTVIRRGRKMTLDVEFESDAGALAPWQNLSIRSEAYCV